MFLLKGLGSLLIILLVAVSILFLDFTYKTFSMGQRSERTDAIVVLAGGRGRVEEGVRLFKAGEGRLLFLVGVDPAVRKKDLFRAKEGDPGIERVFLEKQSRNTMENALYSRNLLQKAGVNSIKLITSRYHMKRAVLIFRNTFPADIKIYPHPVDSRNLREEWWSHQGSFRLLFSEFYKYCLFRLFFTVGPSEFQPPLLQDGGKG